MEVVILKKKSLIFVFTLFSVYALFTFGRHYFSSTSQFTEATFEFTAEDFVEQYNNGTASIKIGEAVRIDNSITAFINGRCNYEYTIYSSDACDIRITLTTMFGEKEVSVVGVDVIMDDGYIPTDNERAIMENAVVQIIEICFPDLELDYEVFDDMIRETVRYGAENKIVVIYVDSGINPRYNYGLLIGHLDIPSHFEEVESQYGVTA